MTVRLGHELVRVRRQISFVAFSVSPLSWYRLSALKGRESGCYWILFVSVPAFFLSHWCVSVRCQRKHTDVLLIVSSSQGFAVNGSNVCGRKVRGGGMVAAAVAAAHHHRSCPHINTNAHSLPFMSSLRIPRITRRLLYLTVCGCAGDCCTE